MRDFTRLVLVITLAALLPALPAAAQIREPEDGATVECGANLYRDGVMAVDCDETWQGFMMPDKRINGHSGLVFCTIQGPKMMCVQPAMINLADYPDPLGRTVKLSCLVERDMEEWVPTFTCKMPDM